MSGYFEINIEVNDLNFAHSLAIDEGGQFTTSDLYRATDWVNNTLENVLKGAEQLGDDLD